MGKAAVRLLVGVSAFLLRSHFRVCGDSMTPRLRNGDLLHVIPRSLSDGPFRRGAIVVARSPALNGDFWVKRVIGLPGEVIALADCGVLVDDARLCEPYRVGAAHSGFRPSVWVCEDGEYFLMGDNRADSSDSRLYGPVHQSAIIGRVWLRWPSWRNQSFGKNCRQ